MMSASCGQEVASGSGDGSVGSDRAAAGSRTGSISSNRSNTLTVPPVASAAQVGFFAGLKTLPILLLTVHLLLR